MKLRAVVTDVDGTITNANGGLDLDAVEEIRRLERSGVAVGLVSGRPHVIVLMLGEYLEVTGPLISENGGVVEIEKRRIELGSRRIAEEAASILNRTHMLRPTWDNNWRLTDYAVTRDVAVELLLASIKELELGVELHVSSIMVHIAKKGVDKLSGLMAFVEATNMALDEVLVAGDAGSDLPLFRGAAMSIAPASASEEVRKLASFVSTRGYADGFIEGIQDCRAKGWLP